MLDEPDYDAPAGEEAWCLAQRTQVERYLQTEVPEHGEVGEWPAWHLAPYVAIWAIESVAHPGGIGWWVISGDLPTDYCSAEQSRHPRDAMRAFAVRWNELAALMKRSEAHPTMTIGTPEDWPLLASLLEARAGILQDWAADDALWAEFDQSITLD